MSNFKKKSYQSTMLDTYHIKNVKYKLHQSIKLNTKLYTNYVKV